MMMMVIMMILKVIISDLCSRSSPLKFRTCCGVRLFYFSVLFIMLLIYLVHNLIIFIIHVLYLDLVIYWVVVFQGDR